jgi:hypothetical protein
MISEFLLALVLDHVMVVGHELRSVASISRHSSRRELLAHKDSSGKDLNADLSYMYC